MNKIRLISLSVNSELAKDIAKYLGIAVTNSTLKRFADGEILFKSSSLIFEINQKEEIQKTI